LGNSTYQLNLPYGLTYGQEYNILFVADTDNHRVMKYLHSNLNGTLVCGNNSPGTNRTQLWYPRGITFDQSTNSVLIANYRAHNVVRWVLSDTEWSIIAGNSNGINGISSSSLYYPTDVKLDPMNNIYIVDQGNHRIQFLSAGQLNATSIAGKTGQVGINSTLFNSPNALALDNQLNLYVVDWYNSRIQKFLRY